MPKTFLHMGILRRALTQEEFDSLLEMYESVKTNRGRPPDTGYTNKNKGRKTKYKYDKNGIGEPCT